MKMIILLATVFVAGAILFHHRMEQKRKSKTGRPCLRSRIRGDFLPSEEN